jgi:hypothetical protein
MRLRARSAKGYDVRGRTIGLVTTVGVTTIGVGCLVAIDSVVAVLVLAGLLASYITLLRPKLGSIIWVVVTLTGLTLERVTRMELLTYADEVAVLAAVALLSARRLASGSRLRLLPGSRYWAAFIAAGVLSSLLRDVPVYLALGGGLLFVKGPLLGLAIAQVDWKDTDLSLIGRLALISMMMSLLACSINVIAPVQWTAMINPLRFEWRGGALPTLIGPFVSPGILGQFSALSCCALLSVGMVLPSGRKNIGWVVLMLGVALLTFRRRTVFALLLAVGGMRYRTVWRARAGHYATGAFLLFILALSTRDLIARALSHTYYEYVVNPVAARILLYRGSLEISADYFPLGAGFSRYGSPLSGSHYSPEYVKLGFNHVWGLRAFDASGQFFTDTFWPAILGETGLVGLIAYGLGLWSLFSFGRRCSRGVRTPERILGILLTGLSIEYAVESLAAPVYVGPPLFGVLFSLAGVTVAVVDRAGVYEDSDRVENGSASGSLSLPSIDRPKPSIHSRLVGQRVPASADSARVALFAQAAHRMEGRVLVDRQGESPLRPTLFRWQRVGKRA